MQWEWKINRLLVLGIVLPRTDSWGHQSNAIQVRLWILLALLILWSMLTLLGWNIIVDIVLRSMFSHKFISSKILSTLQYHWKSFYFKPPTPIIIKTPIYNKNWAILLTNEFWDCFTSGFLSTLGLDIVSYAFLVNQHLKSSHNGGVPDHRK